MDNLYLLPSGEQVELKADYGDFVVCLNSKGETLQATMAILTPLGGKTNNIVPLAKPEPITQEPSSDKMVCRINEANVRILKGLPGFTAGIAARVLGKRPFASYEDMTLKCQDLGMDWDALSQDIEWVFDDGDPKLA